MNQFSATAWPLPAADFAPVALTPKRANWSRTEVLHKGGLIAYLAILAVVPFVGTALEPLVLPGIGLLVASVVFLIATPETFLRLTEVGWDTRPLLLPLCLCFHSAALVGLFVFWGPGAGTIAPVDTALELVRLCILTTVFLGLQALPARKGWRSAILIAIFLIIVVHAATAMIWHDALSGSISGPFANRNAFASYVGLGLIIGVSLAVTSRRPRATGPTRRLRLAGVWTANTVLASALLMTDSRMGLTATLLGLMALLFHRRAWQEALTLLSLGAVAGLIFGQDLGARVSLLPDDLSIRMELYTQIAEMIRERPLTGFGAGSFPIAFEAAHRAPLPAEFIWDRAHSSYLNLWVENGLIFGSLPLVFGIWAAVHLWTRRARSKHSGRGAPAIALGALVLCASHSVFDFSFEMLANQLVLVSLLSIGLARPHSAPRFEE